MGQYKIAELSDPNCLIGQSNQLKAISQPTVALHVKITDAYTVYQKVTVGCGSVTVGCGSVTVGFSNFSFFYDFFANFFEFFGFYDFFANFFEY